MPLGTTHSVRLEEEGGRGMGIGIPGADDSALRIGQRHSAVSLTNPILHGGLRRHRSKAAGETGAISRHEEDDTKGERGTASDSDSAHTWAANPTGVLEIGTSSGGATAAPSEIDMGCPPRSFASLEFWHL